MKRMIIGSLRTLSTILIVLFLVFGLVGGGIAGSEHGTVMLVLGALFGFFGAWVWSSLIFGALFILLDMDDSLRAIRLALERQGAAKP